MKSTIQGKISSPSKLKIERSLKGNRFKDIITETVFRANENLYVLTQITKEEDDGAITSVYLHLMRDNIINIVPQSELGRDAKVVLHNVIPIRGVHDFPRSQEDLACVRFLHDLVRLELFSSSPEIEEEVATHMRHRREMAEEAKQA